MLIHIAKINASTLTFLEQYNYLITNGLGGYSSLTLAGSATRGDHALFMSALDNPTQRYLMVRRLAESLAVGKHKANLHSQNHINPYDNEDGFAQFHSFQQNPLPSFTYRYRGVSIKKELVMPLHKNQLIIRYQIENPHQESIELTLTPHYAFRSKEQLLANESGTDFQYEIQHIRHKELSLYLQHNGKERSLPASWSSPLYFAYDARDGRPATSYDYVLHDINFQTSNCRDQFFLVFSLNEKPQLDVNEVFNHEFNRLDNLVRQSNIKSSLGQELVRACDAFIIKKENLSQDSIIAGYPFFADWGRDSMIASWGALLTTNRFEEMKNLLLSFAKYERHGLIPNLFDPKTGNSRYNSIDASLLFVISCYYYYQATQDFSFIRNELMEVIGLIIEHYKKGTDYGIGMRDNHLIAGGSGEDQLTWMDVNYNGILPTARHGFAVEINAMWYNALNILNEFQKLLDIYDPFLTNLIKQVKTAFEETFWSEELGYLYDYVSENGIANKQLRPNQLFALALPFPLLETQKAYSIINHTHRKLWTVQGLRTLSLDDMEFKTKHEGSHYQRDMAYHQGTVWPFLTGIYADALLRYLPTNSPMLLEFVEDIQLQQKTLQEGCLGHIAEIYDGGNPNQSRGCFAQAWSASEVLRTITLLEKNNLL